MGCILSLLGMQRNHPKYYFKDGTIIFQVKYNCPLVLNIDPTSKRPRKPDSRYIGT